MRRTAIALAGAVLTLVPSLQARTNLWTPPATSASDPDTLEIRLFLVEFKPDESSKREITGTGLFGSDTGTYALESWKERRADPASYARRMLRFAQDYWFKASGGRLVVKGVVDAGADGKGWNYRLGQGMSYFSLPARATGENKTAYWDRTETRLVELVDSAVHRAASDPTGPFAQPVVNTAKKRTIFACMHAGANRGYDGGTKGANGANSQRDLLDFHVQSSSFKKSSDSLDRVIGGIPVRIGASADTLRSILLLPELMSQEGLNVGIGGMLVQQIGSALGLPVTGETGVRDPSPSVLGTWDLMDLGSGTGNAFLPSLPMAWHRLFMGWSTPVFLKPGTSRTTSRPVPSFRAPKRDSLTGKLLEPGQDTVFVVPLDGGEYLLIENRQRADAAGRAHLTQFVAGGTDSLVSLDWKPDSTASLFVDSLTVGSKKVVNSRRPKGLILAASPDAGLPGSGLLVWKINEWVLQEFLSSQVANPWLGDTLQDHYHGITLLQASGKPTLGQRFKNAAGETVLDYGSGSDALPHIRRKMSSDKETGRDTVTAIPAVGYVSTQTTSGARTLVSLRSMWKATSRQEKGKIDLDGDSVITAGDSSLTLEIDWGSLRAPQDSLYPVRLPPGVGAHSVLPGPSRWPLSSWVVDSTGHVQLLDSTGAPLFARPDTVIVKATWPDSIKTLYSNAASSQSLRRFPVQNLSALPAGTSRFPLGTASQGDTLCLTTRDGGTTLVWREGDSTRTATFGGVAWTAPSGIGGSFYVADHDQRLLRASTARLDTVVGLDGLMGIHALSRSRTPAGGAALLAVDSSGRVARVDLGTGAVTTFVAPSSHLAGETFSVASTDFDRDSVADAFVLGSQGTAALYSGRTGALLPGWPRHFARGPSGTGLAGDPGLPAIADLEASGYPQVLFTGTDRLWLVDRNGMTPSGWPVRLGGNDLVNLSTGSRRFPAGVIGSSPLVVDLEGNGSRQVLVGSPDGRIVAFTASASAYAGLSVTTSTGSGTKLGYSVSSWPLAAGARTSDSTLCPWMHPFALAGRLQAVSASAGLELFHTDGSKVIWGTPGGDAGRGFWLDASTLGAVKGLAELSNFHFYPHPVRGGKTTVRYDLGEAARSVSLDLYDQTSFVVLHRNGLPTASGRQQYGLEGLQLGSGVYAARLTVELASGTRTAWFRLAVVR